jgi:hypothetical protein
VTLREDEGQKKGEIIADKKKKILRQLSHYTGLECKMEETDYVGYTKDSIYIRDLLPLYLFSKIIRKEAPY